MNKIAFARGSAVFAAFLLATCSQPASLMVPNCPPGQVLSGNGQELQCVPVGASGDGGSSGPTVPNCAPGQVLTGSNGTLACVTISLPDGGVGPSGDGGVGLTVPMCAANEVLTAMNGMLRCVSLAQSDAGAPNCAMGEVLTVTGGVYSCVRPIVVPTCLAGQSLTASMGVLRCVNNVAIPECAPGQLLVASDGGFSCESATGMAIAGQNMALMALTGQVNALTMQVAGLNSTVMSQGVTIAAHTSTIAMQGTAITALTTQVTTMQTALSALTMRVAALEARPTPRGVATYVGITAVTDNGDINSGVLRGIPAAAEICAAQFGAGAHMCSIAELHRSEADGVFPANSDIAQAWVMATNYYEDRVVNGFGGWPANQGTGDNCGGYTYGTGDTAQTGSVFEWSRGGFGGPRVIKVRHGLGNTPCNVQHPIACCR